MIRVLSLIYLTLFGPGSQAVVDSAESLAANRPYCIQVATAGGHYQPALEKQDISPSRMLADSNSDRYLGFHAVLAVGDGPNPDLYNWSHRIGGFRVLPARMTGRQHQPATICRPRVHFAATLPPQRDRTEEQQPNSIRVAGRSFVIPADFRARVRNELNNPVLTFRAKLPLLDRNEPAPPDFWEVDVYLDPESVKSWLEPSSGYPIIGQSDGPAGLQEETLSSPNKPLERWKDYSSRHRDGASKIRISCFPAGAKNRIPCTYVYMHEGMLVYFSISAEAVPEWKTVQDRISAILSSFAVPQSR